MAFNNPSCTSVLLLEMLRWGGHSPVRMIGLMVMNGSVTPFFNRFVHGLGGFWPPFHWSFGGSQGLGIHPGMAGTHFTPQLLGPQQALRLLLTGEIITGEEVRPLF